MALQDDAVTAIDIALGQSNLSGGSNAIDGAWPENENVLVWDRNFDETGLIGTRGEPLTMLSRGRLPFNDTGSNNLAVHAADLLQRRTRKRSALLLHSKGGEPIGSFLPGGPIWTSLIANMAVLTMLYPNARLRSVMIHHGESAQMETNGWYIDKLRQLLTALRAQPWFVAGTPVVFGQLYCGAKSSARHWHQNYALAHLPRIERNVGLVSSCALDAVEEAFTDTSGAPYRIHFTGESLVILGKRYGEAVLGMVEGSHVPASFSPRESHGGFKPQNPDIITVAAGAALPLTIDDLINEPIIKCLGEADITLPDISAASLSSWVRSYCWRFSVFRNSGVGPVRLHTGNSYTIALGDQAPASDVMINDRALRSFIYTQDTRWRG